MTYLMLLMNLIYLVHIHQSPLPQTRGNDSLAKVYQITWHFYNFLFYEDKEAWKNLHFVEEFHSLCIKYFTQ